MTTRLDSRYELTHVLITFDLPSPGYIYLLGMLIDWKTWILFYGRGGVHYIVVIHEGRDYLRMTNERLTFHRNGRGEFVIVVGFIA